MGFRKSLNVLKLDAKLYGGMCKTYMQIFLVRSSIQGTMEKAKTKKREKSYDLIRSI